jgi:hypothetical protein
MTYEQREPSKHEQFGHHQTQMVDDRVQSNGRSSLLSGGMGQIKSFSSSASDRLARERPPHINNTGASIHAMYEGHQNSKDGKNKFIKKDAAVELWSGCLEGNRGEREGSKGWRDVGKIAVELGGYDGANVGTAMYVHDAHATDHAGLYTVIRDSRDWRSR